MISNKVGVQNFSKATQRHDFGDDPNVHYAAATPELKSDKVDKNMRRGDNHVSEKNLGDQLNDIANPGGVDANKSKRKAHNTLDKDDFLKLMLTQMKNQDPMNPMQSHEMAAQLAQFTSLEQLFNVNKNLEGLTRAQDPMQKYEALNFLGRTIRADSRQILRQQGDPATELRFNLMGDAAKIKLTIADENGVVVKTVEFGNLKKGPNKLAWAGTDNDNRDVKPGKYMFNVEAENGGKKIGVLTETKGTITGVNYTPEGPMLMVGDQKVRLQDVQKIEDENLKTKQNETEAPAAAALGKDGKPITAGTANPEQAILAAEAEAEAKPIEVKPETKVASAYDERRSGQMMPVEGASGNATGAAPKFKKP